MQLIRLFTVFVLVAVVLAAGSPAGAQGPYSLDEVLDHMDAGSAEFEDMSAKIERETVTVFINHSSTETGAMYFTRRDGGSRIRVDIEAPASKVFLIDGGKVRIYNPGIGRVEEFELGEHEDKVEFMVIGFGTSRADLLRYYDVTLGAAEELAGKPVSVLDLVPRDPDIARHFTNIRLWMDQVDWTPVQTRATQHSGDYLIVRFSDVALNDGVSGSTYRLDLPDDVEVLSH